MPIRLRASRTVEERVQKYAAPDYFDLDETALRSMRLSAIKRRDEMAAFKAACGKSGDRDGARFFKEEEADAMKEYRAVCILLPFYSAHPVPGDCLVRDLYEIGPELFPYLARVERECQC